MAKRKASKAKTADQIRKEITDKIVTSIKAGAVPWRQAWVSHPNSGAPCNFVSKRRYTGINPLLLFMATICSGYESKFWGTAKTWKESTGAFIKKGEHATFVTLFRMMTKKNPTTGKVEKDANGKDRKIPLLRTYPVFNVEQLNIANDEIKDKVEKYLVSDLPAARVNSDPDWGPAEALIEAVKKGMGVKFKTGTSPRYNKPSDSVFMPAKKSFTSISEWYETAFHELIHSTESPERAGTKRPENVKPKKGAEGATNYAFNELVAEIGACFLMSELNVPLAESMLENSSNYMATWLEAMANDTKFIFDASSQASKAVDYLLSFIGRANPVFEMPDDDQGDTTDSPRRAVA